MARQLTKQAEIERSIITTYRKEIWSPFVLAVKKYRLIESGDKIAVCISGGKDSMLLAKLMQQLHRHSEVPFELVFLVMDPGYAPENRQRIEENARLLGVPITVFESDVFEASQAAGENSPCYLCARMRRGHLYAKAKQLGCNKIALGHHKSDVIETTLMAMLYGGQIQGMLPKIKSTNFEGMTLVRPMVCVLERDIIRWQNHHRLQFLPVPANSRKIRRESWIFPPVNGSSNSSKNYGKKTPTSKIISFKVFTTCSWIRWRNIRRKESVTTFWKNSERTKRHKRTSLGIR